MTCNVIANYRLGKLDCTSRRNHGNGGNIRIGDEIIAEAYDQDSNASAVGRPRSEAIGEKILAAARALLAEGGYEALTFEAIAGRTGIGRPTIYRRWPTKAHLVAEITYGRRKDFPETGSDLEGQIAALVRQIVENYSRPDIGPATVGLVGAYQKDAALRAELHSPAEAKARAQLHGIVARAKERGVIDAHADADMMFDMVVGTVLFRLVFSSSERPVRLADDLTSALCRAFGPRTG